MVMWRWKNTVFEKKNCICIFCLVFCFFLFFPVLTFHCVNESIIMGPHALSDLSIKMSREGPARPSAVMEIVFPGEGQRD